MQKLYRLKRGSKFVLRIPVYDPEDNTQPADLTGYTVSAQLRRTSTDPNYQAFDITLDPAGEITLALASSVTRSLDVRRYVFDIFLTAPADEPVALFNQDLYLEVVDNVTEV